MPNFLKIIFVLSFSFLLKGESRLEIQKKIRNGTGKSIMHSMDLLDKNCKSNDITITKLRIKRKCKATEMFKIHFVFKVTNEVKYLNDYFLVDVSNYHSEDKYFFRSKRGPPIVAS